MLLQKPSFLAEALDLKFVFANLLTCFLIFFHKNPVSVCRLIHIRHIRAFRGCEHHIIVLELQSLEPDDGLRWGQDHHLLSLS